MFSWRCFPFVDSTPRAYRLKASNAAPLISTLAGTFPISAAAGGYGYPPPSPPYTYDYTHRPAEVVPEPYYRRRYVPLYVVPTYGAGSYAPYGMLSYRSYGRYPHPGRRRW